MPEVVLVIGDEWSSGDELPPCELPVVPRIGESVTIAGAVAPVKDVRHDLLADDEGKSRSRVRVLIGASNRKILQS